MTNEEMLVQIAGMMEDLHEKIVSDVKIMIENDVTKRLDALTDGYQLTHEKQWELERRIEKIEKILEGLGYAG